MALGTDPHSYANFEEVVVTRLDLDLSIDFEGKAIFGSVDISAKVLREGADVLRLDAKALNIRSVIDTSTGRGLDFSIAPPTELSQLLEIKLPDATLSATVRIEYSTTAACSAIQWLEPQQTHGKKHPLVFTQCQAICGRTLFPCQDTPAVKMPFGIKVNAPLPLVAVASGRQLSATVDEAKGVTVFTYEQSIPVMSYLVAIICGNLEKRSVGPRSSIWIEPEAAEAAQAEFDGVPEKFIDAAEKVCGSPYIWGHYDVAVLPKSFAYGGMENPNVTFFSSSLLAGDQSLLTTLAHEITHAWSGNLVTNARWKDFWLNEGFTRYIERRILGLVYGKEFRGLVLTVGYNDLVKTVDMLCSTGAEGLTVLEPDIVGIDPDLAFSRVPYEKGSLFMHYLEGVVGGEDAMTDWLTMYIKDYAEKSIQTSDFRGHFVSFFEKRGVDLSKVDWEYWLHGTKLPTYDLAANVDRTLLEGCRGLADKWLLGTRAVSCRPIPGDVAATDLEGRKAQEVMLFLDHLINAGPGAVPADRLDGMDELYNLSETKNVEVAFRWILLNLKNEHKGSFPVVEKFLSSQGRGSYVRPIYIALSAVDHDFAVEVFRKNESFYQLVIAKAVRASLKIDDTMHA